MFCVLMVRFFPHPLTSTETHELRSLQHNLNLYYSHPLEDPEVVAIIPGPCHLNSPLLQGRGQHAALAPSGR